MKPSFTLTPDLVRFRVRASDRILHEINNAVPFGSGGLRFTELAPLEFEFTVPKSEAPKVLDILERHGIPRTEALT